MNKKILNIFIIIFVVLIILLGCYFLIYSQRNTFKTSEGTTIKFSVPSGYKLTNKYESSIDYEKTAQNGEISVNVQLFPTWSIKNDDEYLEWIKQKLDESTTDINVQSSNIEQLEVNGVNFKKIEITYVQRFIRDRNINQYNYVCQINDNYLYTIQVYTFDNNLKDMITENELRHFLTLNITQ